MAHFEFAKNNSDVIRVRARLYMGHDLVDVRVWARSRSGELVRTPKGLSINVDQVRDLIDGLEWALQQPCIEDETGDARPDLPNGEAMRIAEKAHDVLAKLGTAVHWDMLEQMVFEDHSLDDWDKWHLHHVLVQRRDLFTYEGEGCFSAT